MVKCNRCGVEIDDSFDICPNCGNSLVESEQKVSVESNDEIVCSNCGATLKNGAAFCSECGAEVDGANDNKCEECGSELPNNLLFCPTCGAKVKQKQPPKKPVTCPNCGFRLDDETTFCPECGTNVETGAKNVIKNQSFTDKINLHSIVKPTIISLIVALVLSSIGLLIGLSWISFIIAVILSVGFFAGIVDNEANATVMGLFVGLILGLLETPLVQFWYGRLVAGFYEWIFGGQILVLIILGIICAYVSNMYLKENIRGIAGSFASWL